MAERSTAGQLGRPPRTKPASPDPILDGLQPVFQELGLYGYQARVLLALLQVRSASGVELAALAGIPRSSVYPVLNELTARGLVAQVDGKASVWVSLDQEEVLDRLYAEQEERLRDLGGKVVQAREMLARLAPADLDDSGPQIELIHSAQKSRRIFERSIADTRSELLSFTRLPISAMADEPSPFVLAALERGVAARALYQESDLVAVQGGPLPAALDRYHAAGTLARVIDELPVKLAIFDREVVLLALTGPVVPEVGFPAVQLVRHAGYASLMVRAFDDLWAGAQPYEEWNQSSGSATHPRATVKAAKHATTRRRAAS